MKPEAAKQSSKILPCGCVGVSEITAKCAASKAKAICTNIPFNTKNNGALYQDQRYGNGNRLHNAATKDGKSKGHTCTVCGTRKAA